MATTIGLPNMKKLWKDESGASAAEYAMILAIIGTALAFAAINLADAVAGSINDTAECLEDVAGC